MSTVLSIGFRESDEQVAERIEGCRKLLLRRETARKASCELEAIGKGKAIEVLMEGLLHVDTEVRFHSAYSLAYLDRMECVPVLRDLAMEEPAFRPLCLIGLGANEHPSAREALLGLIQESEPELCYGAMTALRQKNPRDPAVLGEAIGDICQLIHFPSKNHIAAVSLEQQKEIVIFGSNSQIDLNLELSPSPTLRIAPLSGGLLRIAKTQLDGEVLQSIISNDLDSFLRAMPSINANYDDVVHSLDQLGVGKHLSSQVAMNPRPRAGRIYQRDTSEEDPVEEVIESLQVDSSSRAKEIPKRSWFSMTSMPSLIPSKKSEDDESDSGTNLEEQEEGSQP
jgi:hypothetical protein